MEEFKTWEEFMYWNHFRSVSFFRILEGDFTTQLAIPERFYQNFKGKLPAKVALKGRSGATWNVHLTTKNDTLHLQDGWEDFVRAHSLKDDDMLAFTYDGKSCFDVLIYDGKTSCEREVSYFVKNVGSSSPTKHSHGQKRVRRISSGGNEPARKFSEHVSSSTEEIEVLSDGKDSGPDRNRKGRRVTKSERGKGIAGVPEREDQAAGRRKNIRERKLGGQEENFPRLNPSLMIRNPATEEQKVEALAKADKSSSSANSFYVVIRNSHLTDGRLYLPGRWVIRHVRRHKQTLYLQCEGNKWFTRYNNTRGSGGMLVSGWREFVLARSLQVHDVCVFKLSRQKHNGCVVLDVTIHYAGDSDDAEDMFGLSS